MKIEQKALHIVTPVRKEEPKVGYRLMPEQISWRSLLRNGLCMGMDSPCVTGKCDVMCGYGKRYLKEKDKHAG